MQYPLLIRFKTFALAPQITVFDANKKSIAYIRQKIFRFKEHVEVFTDKSKKTLLVDIKADRILDWSANYTFTDNEDKVLGSVGRKGMRSLWKASYSIFAPEGKDVEFEIEEENPIAKVLDSLLGELPVLGFATAFLFQPRYIVKRADSGEKVMRLVKKPALFEGKFEVDKLVELEAKEETQLMCSLLMMTLLERSRG